MWSLSVDTNFKYLIKVLDFKKRFFLQNNSKLGPMTGEFNGKRKSLKEAKYQQVTRKRQGISASILLQSVHKLKKIEKVGH